MLMGPQATCNWEASGLSLSGWSGDPSRAARAPPRLSTQTALLAGTLHQPRTCLASQTPALPVRRTDTCLSRTPTPRRKCTFAGAATWAAMRAARVCVCARGFQMGSVC